MLSIHRSNFNKLSFISLSKLCLTDNYIDTWFVWSIVTAIFQLEWTNLIATFPLHFSPTDGCERRKKSIRLFIDSRSNYKALFPSCKQPICWYMQDVYVHAIFSFALCFSSIKVSTSRCTSNIHGIARVALKLWCKIFMHTQLFLTFEWPLNYTN